MAMNLERVASNMTTDNNSSKIIVTNYRFERKFHLSELSRF